MSIFESIKKHVRHDNTNIDIRELRNIARRVDSNVREKNTEDGLRWSVNTINNCSVTQEQIENTPLKSKWEGFMAEEIALYFFKFLGESAEDEMEKLQRRLNRTIGKSDFIQGLEEVEKQLAVAIQISEKYDLRKLNHPHRPSVTTEIFAEFPTKLNINWKKFHKQTRKHSGRTINIKGAIKGRDQENFDKVIEEAEVKVRKQIDHDIKEYQNMLQQIEEKRN